MFYDFPADALCFDDCDDGMLGNALLVAPVAHAGATSRDVYLPQGPAAWFGLHCGRRFEAGREPTGAAALYTLPLFARAGASIPVARGTAGHHRHDDQTSEVRQFGA